MRVSAKETVLAPGRFLLLHNTASAQTGHCSDGATELAEIWPGEHRVGLGGAAGLIWQPELPFVLLKELWELSAVLLLVLDLFLFKVGRLLFLLNGLFYLRKN